MYSSELFEAALNLTSRMDDYFQHDHRMTMSQRDVPGMTRNSIPILERMGVRAVTVGENSQVAPSAVPPIFSWRDEASGSSVIALFHALGYGGAWPASSSSSRETCARKGMMMVPGFMSSMTAQ